jgi:hypothetical protein
VGQYHLGGLLIHGRLGTETVMVQTAPWILSLVFFHSGSVFRGNRVIHRQMMSAII